MAMAEPPALLHAGKGSETAGGQVEESVYSTSPDQTAVDDAAAGPEPGRSDPAPSTAVPGPAETQTDEPAKVVNGGPSIQAETDKGGVGVVNGDDDTRSVASSVASSELSSGALLALEIKREEIRKGKAPEVITPPSGSMLHSSASAAADLAPSQVALQEVLLDNARDNMSLGAHAHESDVPGASAAVEPGPSWLDQELAEAEAEGYQDAGYVPWEKDPGRPVQKLPIRFKDCLGRTFMFPWEKAKTWEGVRRLIRHALSHVESVGEEVKKGRYDLIAWDVWASDEDAKISPNLTSYPQASPSANPAAADPADQAQASSSSDQSSQDSLPMTLVAGGPSTVQPPPPLVALTTIQNSSGNTPTKDMSARTRNAVILPELWDSIVEPGMLVSMVMWPMRSNHHSGNHGHSGNNNNVWGRGAGPPPPPPAIIHVPAGGRGGRGRGHHGGHQIHHGMPPPPGIGRGRGAPVQPPPMPHNIPGWGVPPPPPRGRGPRLRTGAGTLVRGKTRRRQER